MQSSSQDTLTVKIGGQQLSGWVGYRLVRGVERVPSGLVLEFTDLFPGQAGQAVIEPGAPATAYFNGDLALTGFADLYWPHEDARSHIIRVEIRSKTCDLVDCSLAPPTALPPWVFQAATIGAAAKQICKPFGIDIVLPDGDAPLTDPTTGAPMTFPINPGETCFDLIEYMARTVQMLVFDDAQGRLVLSKVGTTRAGSGLVEGINCEIEEARLSMDQRYSQIMVVGQAPEKVTGHLNVFSTAPHGVDPNVTRYRPLLIQMDPPTANNAWANQRADWEVARRYGRSRIVDVSTSPGHRDGQGNLWTANTIVGCNLPAVKIDQDLLIAEVAYLGSEAGTSTLLTVMPKEGFTPAPFHFVPPVPGFVPQGQ
jgi:prophage tail gpP-like protein